MITQPSSMINRDRPIPLRWSAVFAGVVLAIGFVLVVTSLWSALAFSSDITFFADTIAWWNAATAAMALLVAGVVAGRLSGGGPVAGALHGLAAWGTTVAGTVVLGSPAALATFTLMRAGGDIADAPASWWPVFVAYTAAALCAAGGGAAGGATRLEAEIGPSGTTADVDLSRTQDVETHRPFDELAPGAQRQPATGETEVRGQRPTHAR